MQKYKYYYSGAEFYCYPDTQVLINKFGIKNDEDLETVERRITALKALEFEENPIEGNFNFDYLCIIHKFLFGEIYEWAGIVRGGDYMFKGDTMFFRAMHLEQGFNAFYEKLTNENFLTGLDKGEFCERLAYFMGEMNALHPFREGNGRTSRLYFSRLAEKAGYTLTFSNVKADELLNADILAFDRDYKPLIDILNKVVS